MVMHVDEKSLAGLNVEITNISLNDGTIEGLRYLDHPSFAVQYHPEASPDQAAMNIYLNVL